MEFHQFVICFLKELGVVSLCSSLYLVADLIQLDKFILFFFFSDESAVVVCNFIKKKGVSFNNDFKLFL